MEELLGPIFGLLLNTESFALKKSEKFPYLTLEASFGTTAQVVWRVLLCVATGEII